jgi:hypothetical protein
VESAYSIWKVYWAIDSKIQERTEVLVLLLLEKYKVSTSALFFSFFRSLSLGQSKHDSALMAVSENLL